MSLSDANVVQENSGSTGTVTTSLVTSLPGGTTAGNTVIVILTNGQSSGGHTPPTGFILSKSTGAGGIHVWHKSEVGAGETSWTFTIAGGSAYSWYAVEMSNVDPVEPVDSSAAGTPLASVASGGTASTGTSALNAGLSTLVLSAFCVVKASSGATHTWSGYTNGSDEVIDVEPAAATGYTLAVARKFADGTSTFQTTATLTHSAGGTVGTYAEIVAFRAADAPIVAPLVHFLGFEWGTNGGSSTGGSTTLFAAQLGPTGTWNTNYLIQAGSARASNYGLRVVQSAGAAYVRTGVLTLRSATFGFNVRVVSSTGTVVVAEAINSGLTAVSQLVYDTTTTKFGVRAGPAGTIQYQSGTTALNTWVWVDWRVKVTATTYTADWRIETATDTYTDQTQATVADTTNFPLATLNLGANVSQTATFDFDDVLLSNYWVAYPLGPHRVRLLTVDPAGTPTVSGTTTNFGVFTANTTVGAWNATNARNAVDEVPPTISAAADGATQVTIAATEYMEFPMDTYTLSSTEYVNAVRVYAPLWSATAAACNLVIRGHDGTTETALITATALSPGAPTAVSSTAPLWRTAMWQSTNGWTQAELDAAALRVGFSGDATPDVGVHAIYLEVAVGKTRTRQLFGDFATIEEDPTRFGVVSVTATAPDAGGDSSLYYETSGSPTTVPVPDATTVTAQLNAEDQPTTNYIAFYPPPEGVPDA